jgi:hypothetical protein
MSLTTKYYVSYVVGETTRFVKDPSGHNTAKQELAFMFDDRNAARRAIDFICQTYRYTIHKKRASYVKNGIAYF